MKRSILFVLLIGLGALSSWAGTLTDGLGRTVVVPAVPQRIVSLTPALTELLFALEVQPRVIGVTRQCDYPRAVHQIPPIGDYGAPNLEAIVSVAPDLVVMDAAGGSERFVARLEAIGIPVYVVQTGGLAQTLQMFREVGALVGAASRGEQLARQLAGQLSAVQPLGQSPTAVFCVSLQPFIVATPQTLPGEILQHLGVTNLVAAGERRYPQWTVEALIAADPQLIIVAEMNGLQHQRVFFERLPVLQAVRQQGIIRVDPDLVFRPGPRLGLGVKRLQRAVTHWSQDAQ